MEERTSARSKGTNRVEVPEARGALDRFKFEVANEIGVEPFGRFLTSPAGVKQ